MEIKTIGDILAVPVEEKSKGFEIKITSEGKPNQLYYNVHWIAGIYVTNQRIVPLPKGDYKIIGLASEVVKDEAKCAELVERYPIVKNNRSFYKNYGKQVVCKERPWLDTAIESFQSWMIKHEVYVVNPYGDYFSDLSYGGDICKPTYDEWQEAQQKVSEYLLLREVK